MAKASLLILIAFMMLQQGCASSENHDGKAHTKNHKNSAADIDVDDGQPSAKRSRAYGTLTECQKELLLAQKTCGADVTCQAKMLEVADQDFDSDGKRIVCFDAKKPGQKKAPKRIKSPLDDGED